MKSTQFYHPGACENGWSQWDAFCYRFYLGMKTRLEEEQACCDLNAHLVSIHSRTENRFVNNIVHVLKVWIGYTDVDQDIHYQWSDNTQYDFTNFAKNCTSRENDMDCQRDDVEQQWYASKGEGKSPYTCKRSAQLPLGLLRHISAAQLTQDSWAVLLPDARGVAAGEALSGHRLKLKMQASRPKRSLLCTGNSCCRQLASPCLRVASERQVQDGMAWNQELSSSTYHEELGVLMDLATKTQETHGARFTFLGSSSYKTAEAPLTRRMV